MTTLTKPHIPLLSTKTEDNQKKPEQEEVEEQPVSALRLVLKYPDGESVIQKIQRVSKPGRRIYNRSRDLRPVLNGLGISIISTSSGVLSDREARSQNIGGEVLCQIW